MLGFGKTGPVAEHEASGEIERVYHEIKQTLRVTGVNLNFRTWATYGDFLPLIWDTLRPNVETQAFEAAADQVRVHAARVAGQLGPLRNRSDRLGESQRFQIRAALDLYHYVNPKLLVFTSAVAMSLQGQTIGATSSGGQEQIALGVPAGMYAMEMESDEPEDKELLQLYDDIKKTLSLSSVNSDYRTLALWPGYLKDAWERLKVVVVLEEYRQAADRLRETSRRLAEQLPHPIPLGPQELKDAGVSLGEVQKVTQSFEQLLPGLIINIALLGLDWREAADLEASPFPAASRRQVAQVPHELA